MKTRTNCLFILPAILLLGGCGGLDVFEPSPDSSRHYLFESRITPAENAALDDNGLVVLLGPASVAKHLDQPRIAIRDDLNTVRYSETNRWAAPLIENINRVLMEQLALELDTSQVGSMRTMGDFEWDYRIGYHISALSGMPGKEVRLEASWWIVNPDGGNKVFENSILEQPVDGPSGNFDAYVRALQAVVEEWAAGVVQRIHDLKAG